MMQIRLIMLMIIAFILNLISQTGLTQPITTRSTASCGDQQVHFIFLQVNDVYEITPVNGEGGIARLATLKQQLLAENPNTYMVLAGDLFSPSALGTAKVDGMRLSGKQMVDSMNYAGLDFATLGNHEFDLKWEEFRQRLTESKAKWIISNATDTQGNLFPNAGVNHILNITDKDQETVKVGFFGVMLNSNAKDYVKYSDVFLSADQQVTKLSPQVHMIIAITHLSVAQDQQLAKLQPSISLILGGHEHEHMAVTVGPHLPKVYKADANARSAYIHRLIYHLDTGKFDIQSELKRLTTDIPEDPEVAQVVKQWIKVAYDGFRQEGFESDSLVAKVPIPLNGLENVVRNRPTELTKLLAETMRLSLPGSELSFFNGGLIRIDDVLLPGPITQYDVIRILPFGGLITEIEIKGSLLKQVLEAGRKNVGKGGYLQTAGIASSENNWLINDQALNPDRTYRVAVNDFLLTGKEEGVEFFNRNHSEVKVIMEGPDLRQAFIAELKKRYGQ